MLQAKRYTGDEFLAACATRFALGRTNHHPDCTCKHDQAIPIAYTTVPHELRQRAVYRTKVQLQTILEHLARIGAETMVIEEDYVDQDFLTEHASFYTTCFAPFERYCRRLHFFAHSFAPTRFDEFVDGKQLGLAKAMQSSYLGFVVLKPLPEALIGRTCLRPCSFGCHDEDGTPTRQDDLHWQFTRGYQVHVAGLDLEVNSLAFQEQDAAAAACATTALWTALHRRRFNNATPSPAKITSIAGEKDHSREMPSKGLTNAQMAYTMKKLGLEPEVLPGNDPDDPWMPLEQLYAYGMLGIAPILGLRVFKAGVSKTDLRNPIYVRGSKRQEPEYINAHAVTLTGIALASKRTHVPHRPPVEDRAPLRVHRIEKLNLHDDQGGPFVASAAHYWNAENLGKKRLDQLDETLRDNQWLLELRWRYQNRVTFGAFDTILIPLDPSIRVEYKHARLKVDGFHADLPQVGIPASLVPAEWDLRISTVNDLRGDYSRWLAHDRVPALRGIRRHVLESNWPLYIWRATAFDRKGGQLFEMVMDATSAHRASFVMNVFPLRPQMVAPLRKLTASYDIPVLAGGPPDSTVEDEEKTATTRSYRDWHNVLTTSLAPLQN